MADNTLQPRGFPQFTKLPPEIQLVVWGFHRDRLARRHCFLIGICHRVYEAFDPEKGKTVRNVLPRHDDAKSRGPYNSKIRFTGRVEIVFGKDPVADAGKWYMHKNTRYINAPRVSADLDYDLFYFHHFPYHGGYLSDPIGEWFRFLRKPINREDSRLPANHWITDVRYLALSVPRADCRASEWDLQVLERLKVLKAVWLVIPYAITSRLSLQPDKSQGISKPFNTSTRLAEEQDYPDDDKAILREYGGEVEKSLRDEFKARGITARLTLAVDFWGK
ncbi:hypothetical protein GGR54DRAFT_432372 [Hypoxylon sp. NC1633]|nr:hypothetical protein GGR54DRAFT_432372 [Hypoxylon sp. NC1633]